MFNKLNFHHFLALKVLLVFLSTIAILSSVNAQCPNSLYTVWGINGGPVGIGTQAPLSMFQIHGNINGGADCQNVAITLDFSMQPAAYSGHLALTTPANHTLFTTLSQFTIPNDNFVPPGDIVLQAQEAKDVIITTRNYLGKLRLATTFAENGPDIERMKIKPNGNIGIRNTDPPNYLQIGQFFGLGEFSESYTSPSIMFNCYTHHNENPSTYTYKALTQGYCGLINYDLNGSIFIGISNSTNAGVDVAFSGMTIDNNLNGHSVIGIGGTSEPNTEVKIKGWSSLYSENALKIVNSTNQALFTVRNDGHVGIGTSDPQREFVVNGYMCAKDVQVQLSGSPCWSDYVLKDDYKLTPIDSLAKTIKRHGHLPNIPTAEEVAANGIQLGEMQAAFLKNLEELTLYVFQIHNENKALKKRINKLEKRKMRK